MQPRRAHLDRQCAWIPRVVLGRKRRARLEPQARRVGGDADRNPVPPTRQRPGLGSFRDDRKPLREIVERRADPKLEKALDVTRLEADLGTRRHPAERDLVATFLGVETVAEVELPQLRPVRGYHLSCCRRPPSVRLVLHSSIVFATVRSLSAANAFSIR